MAPPELLSMAPPELPPELTNVMLDIPKIKQRLFDGPKRPSMMKAYGIAAAPETPDQFAEVMIAALDQTPVGEPLEQDLSDRTVFRAAVRSLGSNSRSWSAFLANEARLAALLGDYEPAAVSSRTHDEDFHEAIKECLPGQTERADTRAVLRWADLLVGSGGRFYERIVDVGNAFLRLADERGDSLPSEHLLLCVAGLFAYPPPNWEGNRFLSSPPKDMAELKLPGMGYALASEFLRNLGFSGFKPDRHVCRLFDRWFPSPWPAEEDLARRLAALIGAKSKALRDYLTYSAKGIGVTPDGMSHSHADNLVWLLGAFVETRNHESDECYAIECS